jgi:hypothetical protein
MPFADVQGDLVSVLPVVYLGIDRGLVVKISYTPSERVADRIGDQCLCCLMQTAAQDSKRQRDNPEGSTADNRDNANGTGKERIPYDFTVIFCSCQCRDRCSEKSQCQNYRGDLFHKVLL